MADTTERISIARGNTVPGGRISSSGAVGSPPMPHASSGRSDGRQSWVGRSRFALNEPFPALDENGSRMVRSDEDD